MWSGSDFSGDVEWWGPTGTVNNYSNQTYDSNTNRSLDNSVTSVWNHTNRYLKVCTESYECDSDFRWGLCFAPEAAEDDLSFWNDWENDGDLNNNISSHKMFVGPPPNCYQTVPSSQAGCSM